jgi:hypothetical protein
MKILWQFVIAKYKRDTKKEVVGLLFDKRI